MLSAGPERLDALGQRALPAVVSVGALDMVNFGAKETVPARFDGRQLHVHNAQVTLMRTTADELREAARFIAAKLNRAAGPLTLLLPALFFARAAAAGAPAPDMPAAVLRWGTRALIALSGLLIVFGTAGALASIARHWRGYGPPFGCHAT